MEGIKDTVMSVMSGLEAKKTKGLDEPEAALKKALTKNELRHIKLNYFKKGILGVSVDSSSWLYSLSLKKGDLLVKLAEKLPGLKELKLRIGEVDEERKKKASQTRKSG